MGDKYCSDVGDVVSRSLTVTFDFMCLHRNLTAKTLVTVKDIHVGRYRLKQPLSKTFFLLDRCPCQRLINQGLESS